MPFSVVEVCTTEHPAQDVDDQHLKPALAAGETSYFHLFHLSSRELLGCKVRVWTDLCRLRAVVER